MGIRDLQVTFDANDPRALGLFWREVLGYQVDPAPGGRPGTPEETIAAWEAFLEAAGVPPDQRNTAFAITDPDGTRPRVFFQRVPEGKTAKNRVHLDVRAAPGRRDAERMETLEAECERLVALGATRLGREEPAPPMSLGFIVMADPEGNEFCLD